ncbi:sodium-coupled neutral amino acid transporter 3 isoform X3 [Chrysemys picta bellii]|uniref:sodium-coupled neutral amino acid transporter 3 isoform X3 n=1 Tax=Chrysemys picta bellii TaxID=8478 RepID=UPI0032B0FF61
MDPAEIPIQTELVELVPNGKYAVNASAIPLVGNTSFLLTTVALLSSYSIHLLLKSSGIVGIRAYEQLGYRAFGTPGKLAAAIAITLQNIGAMSSYLYIVKSEVPLVIQTFLNLEEKSTDWYLNGNYLVILISLTIILPLALMKQLGYLGYTSGFSLSCMVFFLISVIYKKFQIPCPLPEQDSNGTSNLSDAQGSTSDYQNGYPVLQPAAAAAACSASLFTLNSQTAYTIPIMAFAFVCHPEVLPIYTELKDPSKKKMQGISNISIAVMYVMYFLAALFGYLTFYGGVGAAAHLQLRGPLRRADPVRARGSADRRDADCAHRPLPSAPRHPADALSRQGLQLGPSHSDRCGPADHHQPAGHLRPLHPRHLRPDWCHISPLPHLHLPSHLLHPHRAQRQGAPEVHPQDPGCRLRGPWRALHGHESQLHHQRLGDGRRQEWGQPLEGSRKRPPAPTPHPGRWGCLSHAPLPLSCC